MLVRKNPYCGMMLAAAVVVGGCDAPGQTGAPQANQPCLVPSSQTTPDGNDSLVVVRGTNAQCTIGFSPVVTLGRPEDATLPRPPVSAAPDGRWLSATYADGEIAVWSPAGDFERVMGNGPGDGPGEFGRAIDLVVDSVAGTVHVLSGSTRVEVYSLEGVYLRAVHLPTPPSLGARLSDGTIATSSPRPKGSPMVILIAGDSASRVGPAGRGPMPAEVHAGREGVWTAESSWYRFDRHALPGGDVTLSIRREVDWFPERPAEVSSIVPGPLMLGFTVDLDRRLILARTEGIRDPEAPSGAFPEGGTPDERRERSVLYFDGMIEAFTFDGELVAAYRSDSSAQLPRPIGGGAPGSHWFHLTGELQSIEIVRPELVQGVGGG